MRILVINPGSTSTKAGLYDDEQLVFSESIHHSPEELTRFDSLMDQKDFRKDEVLKILKDHNIKLSSLDAVVGRGGVLKPIEAGTYKVNDVMINDLTHARVEHASNLGAIIAREIAKPLNIPAFIADPVSVDEFEDIARISGLKEIKRLSLLHTLNIRANAYRYAREHNKKFSELNLVVAHLGGGISVVPIKNGRIVDVNNANEGGPFSPERAGGLPSINIVEMSFSEEYTLKELKKLLTKRGGMVSYLNTNDMKEVVSKVKSGDKYAELIFDAMCYQISKEIAAMSTVLKGNVEAIILTGGVSYNKELTDEIEKRVGWIAPVLVYPGEKELEALAFAVLRVFKGEEKPKEYV
jgi:butyrate kinase